MTTTFKTRIYLRRSFDKCVFGRYRPVVEFRTLKKYRIINGDVCVKFRRRWMPVEEGYEGFLESKNSQMARIYEEIGYAGRGNCVLTLIIE